jgi:hypothetical protein
MTDLSSWGLLPAAALTAVLKRAQAGVDEPRFHKKQMSAEGKKQARRRGAKKVRKSPIDVS